MPAFNSVRIDTALTNFSVMHANDQSQYIADQVFPTIPVDIRSGKYYIYDRRMNLTPTGLDAQGKPLSQRRPGTRSGEIKYSVSTDSYMCEMYAHNSPVPDELPRYADAPLAPDTDATIQCVNKLMLDFEYAIAKKVGTTTNYNATDNKELLVAGTTSWAAYNSVDSNPFTTLRTAMGKVIKGTGQGANTVLMNGNTARVLADHPLVKQTYIYTHQDALTSTGIPKVIRGLNVLDTDVQMTTGAEGAAYSGAQIWKNESSQDIAIVFYKTPTPGLRNGASFGYTFEAPDDTSGARGWAVRRWRQDPERTSYVEASIVRDWKFIANDGAATPLATGGYIISGTTLV